MTESEWLRCTNPDEMIDYHRMKKAPRRLRLLAAACARLAATADAPALVGRVTEAVEGFADGTATRAEFLAARKALREALRGKSMAPSVRALSSLTDDQME